MKNLISIIAFALVFGIGLLGCGAEPVPVVGSPVDLDKLGGDYIWPYGVHGGGHPEGHPGIDFVSTTRLVVTSPVRGVVKKIGETTVSNGAAGGKKLEIIANGNLSVGITHVELDAGIEEGTTVSKGQRLGTQTQDGTNNRFVVHFDTSFKGKIICPIEFMDDGSVSKIGSSTKDSGTLMSKAVYNESGTEGKICNPL